MKGKAARFEKVTLKEGETPQDHGGHGAPNTKETWVVRDADGANAATSFGGANGGEYRKRSVPLLSLSLSPPPPFR